MISPGQHLPGPDQEGQGREPNEPDIYYPTAASATTRAWSRPTTSRARSPRTGPSSSARTKVYILDDTELYGHGIAVVFADTAPKIGLQRRRRPRGHRLEGAATTGRWPPRSARAAPTWSTTAASPRTTPASCGKDLRAVLGNDVKLMGPDGIYEQAFIDDAGQAAEGIVHHLRRRAAEQADRQGRRLVQGYKAKFNGEPEAYAATATRR